MSGKFEPEDVNSNSKCNAMTRIMGSAAIASGFLLPASKRSNHETFHTTDPGATLSDPGHAENRTPVHGDCQCRRGLQIHHLSRSAMQSGAVGASPPTSPAPRTDSSSWPKPDRALPPRRGNWSTNCCDNSGVRNRSVPGCDIFSPSKSVMSGSGVLPEF